MKGIYWPTLTFKKSVIYLIKVNYTSYNYMPCNSSTWTCPFSFPRNVHIKSNTQCGRGDGSVVSSSALFQTRGLNLAIVSSRSVILTPTIVYISARVTTNNRVCSTIDYCSVFSNRYVLNDGPYTFLNSEALVEKLFAINFC